MRFRLPYLLTRWPNWIEHRIELRIGAAFDPQDRMARYVMRLSMALADLRIAAASYAVRPRQPSYERLYFVRLTASHLHEVAILFAPPDTAIPGIEEFIREVVDQSDVQGADQLRSSYKRVQRALQRPVKVPGNPTLGSELKRVRNGFLHYANRSEYEPPLAEAIQRAAKLDGTYRIRRRTMRAGFADEVAGKLTHPWPNLSDEQWLAAVRALHRQITGLIEPVASFLHQAEAAYLANLPVGVVTHHKVSLWARVLDSLHARND